MAHSKFIIPKTNQTPQVELDLMKGTFFMHGKIIPENPFEFFDQLNQGVEKYLQANPDNLEINMQLEYFNTVSSKLLSKFFQKVVSSSRPTLNWYYEKDDIELREAGEDYATIINYPINLIELEES